MRVGGVGADMFLELNLGVTGPPVSAGPLGGTTEL